LGPPCDLVKDKGQTRISHGVNPGNLFEFAQRTTVYCTLVAGGQGTDMSFMFLPLWRCKQRLIGGGPRRGGGGRPQTR
jgi:hypothetical protein